MARPQERSRTMRHQPILNLLISVILVVPFLIGCGVSTSTPISVVEAPAATATQPALPEATDVPTMSEPSATPGLDAEIPLHEGAVPLESGANSNLDQAAQEVIDTVMSQVNTEPDVQTQINIFTLPAEVTGSDILPFYLSKMPPKGWQIAQTGVTGGIQFFNFVKDNGNKTSLFITKDASPETENMAIMVII